MVPYLLKPCSVFVRSLYMAAGANLLIKLDIVLYTIIGQFVVLGNRFLAESLEKFSVKFIRV